MNSETSNSTLIQESASNKLAKLFTLLIRNVKGFEQQDVSSNHIEQTEQFAELLLECLKLYPLQTIAQLSLHRSKAPYFHNFIFNACVFSGLCLLRNKMNLTTAQQIIAGIFTWIVTSRGFVESIEKGSQISNQSHERVKTQMIRALSQVKRSIWLDILMCGSGRVLGAPTKWLQKRDIQNPTHDYLKQAVFIAIQITRMQPSANQKPRKTNSFGVALKTLIQTSHCFAVTNLEPLLDFPGEILPGNVVKISSGQLFLLLGIFKNECYALPYDTNQNQYLDDVKLITKDQITKVMASTPINSLKLLDKWWGRPFKELLLNLEIKPETLITPASFRIDHPPESLTTVIQHLNEQDLDIQKLTKLIESEAGFAEHIRQTASHKSRAKLKISDVKHGLLMNGIERTKSVLVEKALVTRLNQHQFPLQAVLYQFVKMWASFAESIAQRHPRMLPEETSCWVHFAASGLFTNAEIKSQFGWLLRPKNNNTRSDYCISVSHPETLWQHSQKIAVSWSQERELTSALKDIVIKRNLPARIKRSEPHALIALSLLLTTQCFLSNDSNAKDDEYLLQYLATLDIDRHNLPIIQQETLENSHVYWPINNRLIATNG